MYANLRVTVEKPDGSTERLSAWQIKTARTGRIYVYVDDDEGPDEKYANPAGRRDFPVGTRVTIAADF